MEGQAGRAGKTIQEGGGLKESRRRQINNNTMVKEIQAVVMPANTGLEGKQARPLEGKDKMDPYGSGSETCL